MSSLEVAPDWHPAPASSQGADAECAAGASQPDEERAPVPRTIGIGLARLRAGDIVFYAAVLVVYAAAALMSSRTFHVAPDRMMVLATRVAQGHLDSPTFAGTVDSVDIGGHFYIAVGVLQLLPYLPFVAVPQLQGWSPYLTSLAFGLPAAWLCLPLARRYGAEGGRAYAVAVLGAFGTLLFFVSVLGNFYFLAQAEGFLFIVLMLMEWAGRRRALIIGGLFGLAFLARPTMAAAVIPFGLVLAAERWQTAAAVHGTAARLVAVGRRLALLGAPIAVAVAAYALFDWLRFGSPWQNGYQISHLAEPALEARRARGLFSLVQIPQNVRLALLQPFHLRARFPFLVPDPHGLSMLLVSPGLLVAGWAGFRPSTAKLMWAATLIVAVPVFLYYGGGYIQYGFRYSLDFTPFLLVLAAFGSRRWIGLPEFILIAASVASVSYGVLWRGLPLPA